jgi:L-ascorbate metabolism protein UlaG (beta-lactamase superfamily)
LLIYEHREHTFHLSFMVISWLGDAGIRIQTKDLTLIIDPPAQTTGFKHGKLTADVVALTQAEGRDADLVSGVTRTIETAGEYEVKQVFFYGLSLPSAPNQIHFRVEAEELSLAHVGSLTHTLDNGELASLEGVDILFIPVGGKSVLSAEAAAELISKIEPRIVIPIQFHVPGDKSGYDGIEKFLKEFGVKASEPQSKIKLAKKDLPAEETLVIVPLID